MMTTLENTILYIDDEIENLDGFEFAFMMDYKIFTASKTKDAIEILKKNEIKVVISDQKMPEITGIEFMKMVKEEYPETIRIILTAYADVENAIDAINNGEIYRYLSKPWKKNELKSIIDSAIERYNLRKDNKNLITNLINANEELKQTNQTLHEKIEELKLSESRLQQKNEEYQLLNYEYEVQNQNLVIARDIAEENNRLKSRFLTNLSHEIRTPMNGIIGFADMLSDSDLTDESRKYYTSIIINSGQQLMRIIDDILEISKLETKQVKVVNNEVCVNDLLMEMFAIYDRKAKENKTPLYLSKPLSNKESTILTDETKLRKILNNLVDNALRYTNAGFIELGYYLDINDLVFFVKDTGIGIAFEKQDLIFERFSQESRELSASFGGLGLGLSIAKENAELLGGSIRLESEKGKGSTFFVTIPYKISVRNSNNETDNQNIENGIAEFNKYKILIAEDEEVNYLYMEAILQKAPFKFVLTHAKNGLEAVEFCQKNNNYDILLLDMKMPILSGFEAAKLIREFDTNLTIIAQTAYSSEEEKNMAFNVGCNEFITKPIDKNLLFSILEKYLQKT